MFKCVLGELQNELQFKIIMETNNKGWDKALVFVISERV